MKLSTFVAAALLCLLGGIALGVSVIPASRVSGIEITQNASTPMDPNTQGFWVDTAKRPLYDDGTVHTNRVAACAAATKGDVCVYNGSKFSLLSPGADNQVLTLDHTQSLGMHWAASGTGTAASTVSVVAPARVTIYVRPSGNDSTGDGTTIPTAFRTVDHALGTIPVLEQGRTYFVDITGINDTLASTLEIPPYYNNHPWTINYDTPILPWLNVEGYVNIVATPALIDTLNAGTTTSSSDPVTGLATYSDSSKSYTVNALAGKFLVGSGIAEAAVIRSNTATDIEITAGAWFTAPITVVGTGATLTGPSALATPVVDFTNVNAVVTVNGVTLVEGALSDRSITTSGGLNTTWALCDIGGVIFGANNITGQTGLFATYLHDSHASHTELYVNTSVFTIDSSWIYGVGPGLIGDRVLVSSSIIEDSDFTASFQGVSAPIALNGVYMPNSHHGLTYDGSGGLALLGVRVDGASPGSSNPNGSAIYLSHGAQLEIDGSLAGSGSAGYGLEIASGAKATVNGSAAPTLSITGTLGDFRVGSNPVRTWSSFSSGHPAHNEIDPLVQLCRLGFDDGTAEQVSPPLTWTWRTSDGAVVANTLVKASSGTDGRVVQLAAADDASLTTGIALDTAGGAGTSIRVVELHGQVVSVKSDGALAVSPGDALGASLTSAGRVTKVGAGNMIGRAFSSAAASADATVNVYLSPGSIT